MQLENVVYANNYTSSDGILNIVEDEDNFDSSSFLYFDNHEFISKENFIDCMINQFSSGVITYKNYYEFENGIIRLEFQLKNGEVNISIPPKLSPLNIKREFVSVTTITSENKIITLNQPVTNIPGIIFEIKGLL